MASQRYVRSTYEIEIMDNIMPGKIFTLEKRFKIEEPEEDPGLEVLGAMGMMVAPPQRRAASSEHQFMGIYVVGRVQIPFITLYYWVSSSIRTTVIDARDYDFVPLTREFAVVALRCFEPQVPDTEKALDELINYNPITKEAPAPTKATVSQPVVRVTRERCRESDASEGLQETPV